MAALLGVVVFGGWLRLSGANWDSGMHLHPDERYLTSVASTISWPSSPWQYLDVHQSPLSPYRTDPGKDYLYGQLPLFGGKLFATAIGQDDYSHLNIAGRRLSALVDTGSIVLLFLLALVVFEGMGRRFAVAGGLIAASLYAVTVTVIQSSHFFTMESWLVFFSLLTVLLSAHALRGATDASGRFRLAHVLVGASLGLTVACKVSGALVAVPVLLGLFGETALITRRVGFARGIRARVRSGADDRSAQVMSLSERSRPMPSPARTGSTSGSTRPFGTRLPGSRTLSTASLCTRPRTSGYFRPSSGIR